MQKPSFQEEIVSPRKMTISARRGNPYSASICVSRKKTNHRNVHFRRYVIGQSAKFEAPLGMRYWTS